MWVAGEAPGSAWPMVQGDNWPGQVGAEGLPSLWWEDSDSTQAHTFLDSSATNTEGMQGIHGEPQETLER